MAQTVTVSAAADDDAADDTAELRHAASGADYGGVRGDAVAVSVTDIDTRGVTSSVPELNLREGGIATYTLVLDTKPTGTVTVRPSVTGNTDVTVSPSQLGFTTSNWNRPKTVTVRAGQDLDREADSATVSHVVTGADYGDNDVTASDVAVTVTDDDVPSTTIALKVSPETVRESARSAQLSGAETVTVTATLYGAARAADTVITLAVTGATVTVPADATVATGRFRLVPVWTLVAGCASQAKASAWRAR